MIIQKRALLENHTGFTVIQAGILTSIQDLGRFGYHNIGLTTGGPLDPFAFKWANKLCANKPNDTGLEITIGGLELESHIDTFISVTGAKLPLFINKKAREQWKTLAIKKGDKISLGFATEGIRAYLAVAGGFDIKQTFGSTSTVVRENIGGFNGGKLMGNEILPCTSISSITQLALVAPPNYSTEICLRVILGYQDYAFTRLQKRLFFSYEYQVSESCDRMGYRLNGPAIKPDIGDILSEGICLGAIQIPANGQPIILMNDRQTIGGYPKIGTVLSLDLAKLAQCQQGAKVRFEMITIEQAHNILHLAQSQFERAKTVEI